MPYRYRFAEEVSEGEFSSNANLGAYFGIRYDFGRHQQMYFRKAKKLDI
jgi:hypothetical protein